MNVFGIGPMEIALIAIIAVVVLGPERFPQAAVQIARAVKWLRSYANSSTAELRAEFAELTKEYEGLRKELSEMRGSLGNEAASVTGEVSRVLTETRPRLQAPSIKQLMGEAIVEPGGELPPDRANGGSSQQA